MHRLRDITQEVFVVLAGKAGLRSRHPSLVAWLPTSACYAVVNVIHAERRRVRREAQAETMPYKNDSMAPSAEQVSDQIVLSAADEWERSIQSRMTAAGAAP